MANLKVIDSEGNLIDMSSVESPDTSHKLIRVDQKYKPESTNAQSGIAVAEAVADAINDLNPSNFVTKELVAKDLELDSDNNVLNEDDVSSVKLLVDSLYTLRELTADALNDKVDNTIDDIDNNFIEDTVHGALNQLGNNQVIDLGTFTSNSALSGYNWEEGKYYRFYLELNQGHIATSGYFTGYCKFDEGIDTTVLYLHNNMDGTDYKCELRYGNTVYPVDPYTNIYNPNGKCYKLGDVLRSTETTQVASFDELLTIAASYNYGRIFCVDIAGNLSHTSGYKVTSGRYICMKDDQAGIASIVMCNLTKGIFYRLGTTTQYFSEEAMYAKQGTKIKSPGNYFEGRTVEGALQQLGTSEIINLGTLSTYNDLINIEWQTNRLYQFTVSGDVIKAPQGPYICAPVAVRERYDDDDDLYYEYQIQAIYVRTGTPYTIDYKSTRNEIEIEAYVPSEVVNAINTNITDSNKPVIIETSYDLYKYLYKRFNESNYDDEYNFCSKGEGTYIDLRGDVTLDSTTTLPSGLYTVTGEYYYGFSTSTFWYIYFTDITTGTLYKGYIDLFTSPENRRKYDSDKGRYVILDFKDITVKSPVDNQVINLGTFTSPSAVLTYNWEDGKFYRFKLEGYEQSFNGECIGVYDSQSVGGYLYVHNINTNTNAYIATKWGGFVSVIEPTAGGLRGNPVKTGNFLRGLYEYINILYIDSLETLYTYRNNADIPLPNVFMAQFTETFEYGNLGRCLCVLQPKFSESGESHIDIVRYISTDTGIIGEFRIDISTEEDKYSAIILDPNDKQNKSIVDENNHFTIPTVEGALTQLAEDRFIDLGTISSDSAFVGAAEYEQYKFYKFMWSIDGSAQGYIGYTIYNGSSYEMKASSIVGYSQYSINLSTGESSLINRPTYQSLSGTTYYGSSLTTTIKTVSQQTYTNKKSIDSVKENVVVYTPLTTTDATQYGNLLAKIPGNIITNINNSTTWTDMPSTESIAFINWRYTANYNVQIGFGQQTGTIWFRIVNRNTGAIYTDWKSITSTDNCFQFRDGYNTNDGALAIDNKLVNIVTPGSFGFSSTRYTDLPVNYPGGDSALYIFQQSSGYNSQMLLHQKSGRLWNRIVKRTKTVYRDWVEVGLDARMKVLALGDSICRGYRNGEKGFIGDLGLPYKNIGVSSATISNKTTSVMNIPDQLTNLKTTEPEYIPDVIIGEGGINDYFKGAPLGEISVTPVYTDEQAETLDRNTVMGALEYLFYKMITLYPKAQRFFLITHKTWKTNESKYCVDTPNSAGWTQQDLHDAIVECCNVYNVKVIDIYKDSMINTRFDVYRSTVAYSTDNSITNTEYCDTDGVHPCDYGYKEGYLPFIKQAIGIGTVK